MNTAAFWLALLRALPELIALLSAIANRVQSARDRREGYDDAVAGALKEAADGLQQATEAANEAAERHRKDQTDDAFDTQFRRD